MNPVTQNRFNYDVDFPPLKKEESPKKSKNDKSTEKVTALAHQQIKEVNETYQVIDVGFIKGRKLTSKDIGKYIVRVGPSIVKGMYSDHSYFPRVGNEHYTSVKLEGLLKDDVLQLRIHGFLVRDCCFSNDGGWSTADEFRQDVEKNNKALFPCIAVCSDDEMEW